MEDKREQNFVSNELAHLGVHPAVIARQHRFKAVLRGGPILFQKRNLRQVKIGVPKSRIEIEPSSQDYFRSFVFALAHQNDTAEIEQFRFHFCCRGQTIDIFQVG